MEFKKKIILTVAIMGLGLLSSYAQTGIGTLNPDNSAQLDLTSSKRGLLMPRIALVKTTEQTPVVGVAAKSLMVYNTATINDVKPGFYYWDSTKWIRVGAEGDMTGTNLINVTNGKNNAFKDTEISLKPGNYTEILQTLGDSITPMTPQWVPLQSVVQEPWYDGTFYVPATDNKQSLYTQGKTVTIGKYPVKYANFASPGLDVVGAIKFGTTNEYPMQDNTLAGGNNVALTGVNGIAVGSNIVATGVGSTTFGSNNTNRSASSLVAGWNNVAGYAGASEDWMSVSLTGTTIFGQGNSVLLSVTGRGPAMDNNTIFGQNNKIDSQGNVPIGFSNNTIFGDTNIILGGSGYASANNTIFGSHNSIPVYQGANAAVFGQDNIANKSNQFVLGSGNENVDNALFEIGIGSSSIRANAVTVLDNGNVGIGTSAPGAYKLLVNGQAGGTSAWTQSSDRRYKKDITPITGALDKIMKIEGVGYNWKTEEFKDMHFDNKHQLGVIAQDIEKIVPDAVTKDDKGYYSVSYTTLVPVLIEAVKEQQKQIDELKALVKQLTEKK